MPEKVNTALQEKIEKIEAEFADYAYIISHDLSAPIRSMVEFSKILAEEERDSLSEESRQYLKFVVDGGEKLQRQIQGLLDYSRLNTQRQPHTEIYSAKVAAQCAKSKCAEFGVDASHVTIEEMPMVVADGSLLALLFAELINNALKFNINGDSPEVHISASENDKEWVFSVQDNGIGIDPRFSDKIFRIFQRLHTEEEYPGIGMGLALAKKIVEQHGGKIWFEPRSGGGTTFFFSLSRSSNHG